ncbi:MAG: hypothetical protein JWN10_1668 [Solirubrobacterales bacterium]|nr:hypothetical protein [Solirubrobacterales bacterium]
MTQIVTHIVFLYIDEILPAIEIDYENYRDCEENVIAPALVASGYVLKSGWFTGDGDTFGPLTRCIETDRGTVVYG